MYLYQANSATNGHYERRVNFGTVPGATGDTDKTKSKLAPFMRVGW